MPEVPRRADECHVSSVAFWSRPAVDREETFRLLREQCPVSWHPPAEGGLLSDPGDRGFWAVVTHADIVHVSRHPEDFCSGLGVMFDNIPEAILEMASSFLATDAPRHTHLRRLISSAFTPRQVARIDAQIANQVRTIVDDVIREGPTDFMRQIAGRLPMWTISEMVGVDVAERSDVAASANEMVAWNDAATLAGRAPLDMLMGALVSLHGRARELAERRRTEPTEDLMSALVAAEVDGHRLTEDEIAAFFVLLAVAGNDTTKNSIAHGVLAIQEHEGARRALAEHFDAHVNGAVEEVFRWASPVMTFRRTATRNVMLGGQEIAAGEKVVMFYPSGNRDAAVFDHPEVFDITRSPNPHLGFGGGGPHFCLGASLARTQLRCVLSELRRLPDLVLGSPSFQVGNFIHGISTMPFMFDRVTAVV
jgi:cytochrome P450